jgi:type II secretory pathway predicted ATPase ExeA
MKLGVLAALEQRVTVRRHMTGMTPAETAGYIAHHLRLAGRSDPLFTDDATSLIHTAGRGKPRAVNRLAVAALIATCAAGKALVDEAGARSAVTETTDPHAHDAMTTPPTR